MQEYIACAASILQDVLAEVKTPVKPWVLHWKHPKRDFVTMSYLSGRPQSAELCSDYTVFQGPGGRSQCVFLLRCYARPSCAAEHAHKSFKQVFGVDNNDNNDKWGRTTTGWKPSTTGDLKDNVRGRRRFFRLSPDGRLLRLLGRKQFCLGSERPRWVWDGSQHVQPGPAAATAMINWMLWL